MSGPKFLFEFEDLDWFPQTIRESMTDFLRYLLRYSHFYEPVVPIIREGLEQTESQQLFDLCSGSAGPALDIISGLEKQGVTAQMTLTDKFPNLRAWQSIQRQNPNIRFIETPVDATHIPEQYQGFRTMFSAVHHLNEETISGVLKNAATHKEGIAIFDGGDKNIPILLAIVLFHPLLFFFATPFFRPFRFSRIFFTYLIPIIPFCTVWDGVVSIVRLYRPDELLSIAQNAGIENYRWRAGQQKNKFGMRVTYLIGYPQTTHAT